MSGVCGIVLAAGAGTRYGGPKARARTHAGEPWLVRAVAALAAGGCDPIFVALGADLTARDLVPSEATAIVVADWTDGLSASVRAALTAAADTTACAVLFVPVDTPDMPATVVARLAVGVRDRTLRRAVYGGGPGHPVVVGRRHWAELSSAVSGDRGAGAYLAAHAADEVECGDLWDGADIDERPSQPPAAALR